MNVNEVSLIPRLCGIEAKRPGNEAKGHPDHRE